MPRPNKKGFDYFSLDCSFFDDIKTRKLVRRCGADAVAVYVAILCLIFKEGYYLVADEDLSFIVSEKTGLSEDTCDACIRACVEVGMFDSELFSKHIVTSHGIQRRYQSICVQSKRSSKIDEYCLVSSGKTGVSSEKTPVSSEETTENDAEIGVSSGKSTQRKEKKRKVNKNNSSFNSSLWSDEEKEKILFNFFFRNLAAPEKELTKFLEYNKNWGSMSEERKTEVISKWQQQPPQAPRFGQDFLIMWKKLYEVAKELDAPAEIINDILSDRIEVKFSGNQVHLYCTRRLTDYIESEEVLVRVRSDFIKYSRSKKALGGFKYHDVV